MEVFIINPKGGGRGPYKKVVLNQAEILALNTTKLQILPAPGPSKTYSLKEGSGKIDNNGTAMTGANTGIQLDFENGSEFANIATGFLAETTEHKTPLLPTIYAGSPNQVANEAVYITAVNDMTLGDAASSLTIEIYYNIVPQ